MQLQRARWGHVSLLAGTLSACSAPDPSASVSTVTASDTGVVNQVNLFPQSIGTSPQQPVVNNGYVLSWNECNTGYVESGAYTSKVEIQSETTYYWDIPSVPPGQCTSHNIFVPGPFEPGYYQVAITSDFYDEVEELNEYDNVSFGSFTAISPPDGGGGDGCSTRPAPTRCIRGQDCCPTPIVVDVDGNGYDLTAPSDGVVFDIDASGHPEQVSWTSPGSDDAWLVLDRNGNGVIDDATELFGDHTPQPASDHANGFLALGIFDTSANGGNNDGWISSDDAVYSQLRLWVDRNHNAVSEPDELHPLLELGVAAIEVDARSSRRVDANGNAFGYRARVKHVRGAHDGRWAYDVFLRAGAAGAP